MFMFIDLVLWNVVASCFNCMFVVSDWATQVKTFKVYLQNHVLGTVRVVFLSC